MGDKLDLMLTCSKSVLATGLPPFHVVGGALALSAGLNSGVGGSETSADDEDRDEVGSRGYGSSSKFCTWMGMGAAGAEMACGTTATGAGLMTWAWPGWLKSIWSMMLSSMPNADESDRDHRCRSAGWTLA